MLQRQHVFGSQHRRDLGRAIAGGRLDDRLFLFLRGIGHSQLEHEAVELRLGQGIGALLLDRVLGGEHEERDRKSTTSELQSHSDLVCRLLLEKKKIKYSNMT